MRRISFKPLFLWFLFFFVIPSLTFSEEPRYRTFSEDEIKKMAEQMAVIHTKFGDITLKFFPQIAPNHVDNFITLSRSGVYDGTLFHRVIPYFVIQGGDPFSKGPDRSQYGRGGPGYQLKAEFSSQPHKRGTLSMARSTNPDSAGSQFFICVADRPDLDGLYTVFGEVVEGMDVVDTIVSQPRDAKDIPLNRIEMTSVFIYGQKWAGATQLKMKLKKSFSDKGNIKIKSYSTSLTGTLELYIGGESPVLNQDGYYMSFLSDDGTMAFYIKDTGSVSTSNIKNTATDTFYLKGTGGFSLIEDGEVFNGVAFLDITQGTMKKDKSGEVSSIILSGTVGGGSGDERIFGGSFKVTLTPLN